MHFPVGLASGEVMCEGLPVEWVVVVEAHESCVITTALTRRDPLSAVVPGLQLKFQDSGMTVTNWDRVR
jgi:hypothetical protein